MNQSSRTSPVLIDRTLTDQVVRGLRKQIMLGQLEPGQRLTEIQLAEQMDVSRSTIREALRRLEAEYLIETVSHRGSRVARLAPSDAVEICELHAMLESYCLKHLPLPIPQPLRNHLEEIVAQMQTLAFPVGADRFIDLDHEFHRSIVQAARQRWVMHVWSDINALLGVLVTLSIRYLRPDAETIAARHQAIIDVMSRPEVHVDEAARVAEDHYQSLARVLGDSGPEPNGREIGAP